MGNNFEVFVVIIPLTIIEAAIFYFCKVEAEERVIYQEFARNEWPKGAVDPSLDKRERLDTFESIQKHFFRM